MKNNHCIRNLLKLICLLQENSINTGCLEDGCSKPYLGPNINNACYNTRIITLYNKNGTLLNSNYENNGEIKNSSFFRVEKVFDDAIVLRILDKNNNNYIATNNFITVNLKCICAIKCIKDVVIENL